MIRNVREVCKICRNFQMILEFCPKVSEERRDDIYHEMNCWSKVPTTTTH